MSPALIHGEVDLWLASEDEWVNENPERRALVDAWNECAAKYGAGHPAALGCLLALVREAWALPGAHVVAVGEDSDAVAYEERHSLGRPTGWRFIGPDYRGDREPIIGSTEAAALVAALQGAP